MFQRLAQKSVRLVDAKGLTKWGARVMPRCVRAGLLTPHISSSMDLHMTAIAPSWHATDRAAPVLWQL